MKRTHAFFLISLIAGCSSSTEESKAPESLVSIEPAQEMINSNLTEELKQKITNELTSENWKMIEDVRWFNDRHLGVAIIDDGSRRDGYAGSICLGLGMEPINLITPKLLIEVFDHYAITISSKWEQIGKFDCVIDGSDPILVDFTNAEKLRPSMQNLPPPNQ